MKLREWAAPALAVAIVIGAAWAVYARVFVDDTPPLSLESTVEAGPGVRGVFVLPDDGREPLAREIESARNTIDVMMYLLTDEQLIEQFLDAERRGVQVRVILEQHPFGGFGNPEQEISRLRAGGAEVKWGRRAFPFTHAKVIVIDRSVAVITNANATPSSFSDNREFGVVTTFAPDVAQAASIFEADWDNREQRLDGPLLVSPETSREGFTRLIEDASTSLDIYAEVIRDDQMVDLLIAAEGRGVEVRIVTSPDSDPRADVIFERLERGGVALHILTTPYIHAKMILADDRRLFIGSQNFTATSLDENREIGVVFEDEIANSRVRSVFAEDFAAAPPWR